MRHASRTRSCVLPPGKENGEARELSPFGWLPYQNQTISADLVGAALPLENFEKITVDALACGRQVSFRLKANGSVRTPVGEGTFRVVTSGLAR